MDVERLPNAPLEIDLMYYGDYKHELVEGSCMKPPENLFAAFMLLLVVIGLFGNIFIILIILTLKEYKKSVANWYILQLAIADGMFLVVLPFEAVSEMRGGWEFPLWLCRGKQALLFINYYASIYFLMVMSFDRYLAVTKAFAFSAWVKTLRTFKMSLLITLVGWILSISACTPLFLWSDVSPCPKFCAIQFPMSFTQEPNVSTSMHHFGNNKINQVYDYEFYDDDVNNSSTTSNFTYTVPNHLNESVHYDVSNMSMEEMFNHFAMSDVTLDDFKNIFGEYQNIHENDPDKFQGDHCIFPDSEYLRQWVLSNFVIAFCVPFCMITCFYGMIIRTIMQTSTVSNTDSQRSYRKRVTFIVFMLVGLFVISWLPWHIHNILKIQGFNLSYPGHCDMLHNAVRIIAYMNSAFNPYFYSFLGVRFKERIKRMSSTVSGLINKQKNFSKSGGGERVQRKESKAKRHGSGSNPNHSRNPQETQSNKEIKLFRSNWLNRSNRQKKVESEGANGGTMEKTERTIV